MGFIPHILQLIPYTSPSFCIFFLLQLSPQYKEHHFNLEYLILISYPNLYCKNNTNLHMYLQSRIRNKLSSNCFAIVRQFNPRYIVIAWHISEKPRVQVRFQTYTTGVIFEPPFLTCFSSSLLFFCIKYHSKFLYNP